MSQMCPQHHIAVDRVLGCLECAAEIKRLKKKAANRRSKAKLLHRREFDPDYDWGGVKGRKK